MSTIIPTADRLTIIMSAELDYMDAERNSLRTLDLRERLARQFEIGEVDSLAACAGAYKGTPEKSFAFIGQPGTVRAIARGIAEYFGQESVLLIDHTGRGELLYTVDGQREHIGTLAHIDDVESVDAWTRVIATGETFTFC